MSTKVNCGFEVFIPKKTLNYEVTQDLRARFWTSAGLQIAVPTEEEPDLDKITSAFEEMLRDIKEAHSMVENAKPNEFVDFCDKKRKNFLAPPAERIYES